jgi:hypothetical protein
VDEVVLHVIESEGDDVEELDELTGRLRADLLELDVASVDHVAATEPIPGRVRSAVPRPRPGCRSTFSRVTPAR